MRNSAHLCERACNLRVFSSCARHGCRELGWHGPPPARTCRSMEADLWVPHRAEEWKARRNGLRREAMARTAWTRTPVHRRSTGTPGRPAGRPRRHFSQQTCDRPHACDGRTARDRLHGRAARASPTRNSPSARALPLRGRFLFGSRPCRGLHFDIHGKKAKGLRALDHSLRRSGWLRVVRERLEPLGLSASWTTFRSGSG
jgi:hypothetical protein